MNEINATLIIELSGNLQQRAREYENALLQFSANGVRSLNLLQESARSTQDSLYAIGNRLVNVVNGGALVDATKQMADLSAQLNQLGINSGLNGEALEAFKEKAQKSIGEAAVTWGVKSEEIAASMRSVAEKSRDPEYALKMAQTNAQVMAATHLSGGELDQVSHTLKRANFSPEQATSLYGTLLKQQSEGGFGVRDFAANAQTLFNAKPFHSVQEFSEDSALLQMLTKSTGSSGEAVSAYVGLMEALKDPKTLSRLRKAKIQVTQKDGSLLPTSDIVQNLLQGTGGDSSKLTRLVGAQSGQTLSALANPAALESYKELLQMQDNGSELTRDAADHLREMSAQYTRVSEAGKLFAAEHFEQPMQILTDAINAVPTDTLTNIVGTVMSVGAAGEALLKGWGAYREIKDLMKTVGGATAPAGRAGVFRPSTFGLLKDFSLGEMSSIFGRGALVPAAGYLAAAGVAGYGVGTVINKGLETWAPDIHDKIGESVARALAAFGSKEAREALNSRSIHLQIETTEGAVRARVKSGKDVTASTRPGAVMGPR